MWLASQLLLPLYYKLDNGANTCSIDFHFENPREKKRKRRGGETMIIIPTIYNLIVIFFIWKWYIILKVKFNCASKQSCEMSQIWQIDLCKNIGRFG